MPRASIYIVMLLVMAGCASGQVLRTAAFSSESKTTLVVFGLDVQSNFKTPTLVFRRYDPRTGKVDLKGEVRASPRSDKLTGGQRLAAALTGQDARPGGHGYFVLELPEGSWFLCCLSGFYNDGFTSYSSNTYFSEGALVLQSQAGTAAYLGEYMVSGRYGENLRIEPLPANLPAAQSELDTFANVKAALAAIEPQTKPFSCESKVVLFSKVECVPATMVVKL